MDSLSHVSETAGKEQRKRLEADLHRLSEEVTRQVQQVKQPKDDPPPDPHEQTRGYN